MLNLYGIKGAGDIWQEVGEKRIFCVGWEPVSHEDWKDVCFHPKYKAYLEVYVDDFKMAAPEKHIHMLWSQLRELIVLDAVERDARFLGGDTKWFESTAGEMKEMLEWHPSYDRRPHLTKDDINGEISEWTIDPTRKVRGKVYDLQSFVDSCVGNYCELGNIAKSKLRTLDTPFIDETKDPSGFEIMVRVDAEHQDDSLNVKRANQALAKEAAEIAKRLRDKKRTAVTSASSSSASGSPGPTASGSPEQFDPYAADPEDPPAPETCALADVALKVNMKNMWVGRYARRDIGRAVGHLATKVSRWTPPQDKKLHRLMSYMHHSREFRQIGFIGAELEDLRLGLFADADFPGDKATMTGTSGIFMAIYGPNSFFPDKLHK